MSLEVVRPGPLTLIQDAGRPGYAAVGVGPSGAFDRAALASGARLLGNDPSDAALEVTLGGLVLRAVDATAIALTGADCRATVDGEAAGWGTVVTLAAGQILALGFSSQGLRAYVSVAGGITVEPVLGSRSADLLSGLGPAPLAAGDILPSGPRTHHPRTDVPLGLTPARRPGGPVALDLMPGPRTDWLADPAELAGEWLVAPASNRIGVRLSGRVVTRASALAERELASEPIVAGAVQLPPSGLPVIFGPDHPTTGGYPVVAVLTGAGRDLLAQCRPGDEVQLRWVGD